MDKLKMEISLKDTEEFKSLVSVLKEVCEDKEVPENVREKYLKKIRCIVEG